MRKKILTYNYYIYIIFLLITPQKYLLMTYYLNLVISLILLFVFQFQIFQDTINTVKYILKESVLI